MFNFDKKIKKVLKKSSTLSKSIANPLKVAGVRKASLHPSFKLKQKTRDLKELATKSIFFPFTEPKVKSPYNKMMGDYDKDGVRNIMDCKPWNKKRHGGEMFWEHLHKRNIMIDPGATPADRKQIRQVFEKNPELIDTASGTFISTDMNEFVVPKDAGAVFAPQTVGISNTKRKLSYVYPTHIGLDVSKTNKGANIHTIMKHEIKHKEQYDRDNDEYRKQSAEAGRMERERHDTFKQQTKSEAKARGINRDMIDNRQLTPSQQQWIDKSADEYSQIHKTVPLEAEAYATEYEIPERKKQVPQEQIEEAYREVMDEDDE